MNRRIFIETLGGIGMLRGTDAAGAAGTEKRTNYYLLENYYLKNGTQVNRLHDMFSKAVLPALNKVHSGPKIYLEAIVAPHMPQVVAIYGFETVDAVARMHEQVMQHPGMDKAFAEWEQGPEPATEQQASTLLAAAAYSPEIKADGEPLKAPRIFELRVYHSPTWRQLRALHERFAGPEIKIFRRSGINPLFYTSTVIGQNMPNLTYLIPFESLAAREKAWNAFSADPEWVKVRQESIDKHGQISSVIQISLFKATAYSPVR